MLGVVDNREKKTYKVNLANDNFLMLKEDEVESVDLFKTHFEENDELDFEIKTCRRAELSFKLKRTILNPYIYTL